MKFNSEKISKRTSPRLRLGFVKQIKILLDLNPDYVKFTSVRWKPISCRKMCRFLLGNSSDCLYTEYLRYHTVVCCILLRWFHLRILSFLLLPSKLISFKARAASQAKIDTMKVLSRYELNVRGQRKLLTRKTIYSLHLIVSSSLGFRKFSELNTVQMFWFATGLPSEWKIAVEVQFF